MTALRSLHQPRSAGLRVLVLAFITAPLFPAAADEPSFQIGFPKWGDTPRVCEYHWCEVPFEVVNPGARETEVILAIRSAAGGEALYSKFLRLGPRAQMRDSLFIVSERTREYYATLTYPDGRQIQNQQVMSDFQNPYQHVAAYFVSDNPDLEGVSALAKDRDLGRRLLLTRSRSRDLPPYAAALGATSLLVLTGVDFTSMAGGQFTAIEDFVASGGTLAVLHPQTLTAIQDTPLAALMPTLPVGTRRVATLPELGNWEGDALPGPTWKDGTPFFESTPKAHTEVPVWHGAHPLLAWGQWGLGRVVVCAFDPFTEATIDTDYSRRVWRHILSGVATHPFGGQAMHRNELSAVAARLIGFTAPSADMVRNIMATYFILILALFILGCILRKQVASWLLAVACSLVLTWAILAAAGRQLQQQATKNAIIVDLACQTHFGDDATFVGEKRVSLINRQDDRPDVQGLSAGVWLRPEAPAPAAVAGARRVTTMLSSLRQASRSSLQRLDVHENKPTTFYAVYHDEKALGVAPPRLINHGGGLDLLDGELPAAIAAANPRAYLILGQGFRRLRLDGRRLVLSREGGGGLEMDAVAREFESFLRTAGLPSPAVALLYKAPVAADTLRIGDSSYVEQRHMVHLVPVSVVFTAGPTAILGEDLPLVPVGRSARALRWENEWQEGFIHTGQSTYLFAVELPLWARRMAVDEAEINLAVANSDGTVSVSAELVPFADGGVDDERSIKAQRAVGSTLLFADLTAESLINPVDGRLLIKLIVSSSLPEDSARHMLGGGKWRILDFSVALNGERFADGKRPLAAVKEQNP